MIIYLASRYIRRLEMVGHAIELRRMGHTVTSRWLEGEHQWDGAAVEAAKAYEDRGEMIPAAQRFALDDVEDITAADTLITFTEKPREFSNQRGGRHVEFGLAYAMGKRIIVVGYQENVFHLLPGVEFAHNWGEAKVRLGVEVVA